MKIKPEKIEFIECNANTGSLFHFEAAITDLMVFIGPDELYKDLICRRIKDHSDILSLREPEQGLFPIAQNEKVAEIVEQFNVCGGRFLLTTHSPYILTALNNYIYAYQVGQKKPDEVNALIPKHLWIDPKRVSAYFVENGTVRSIMDEELQQIDADKIDEASTLTNKLYDQLLDIKVNGEIDDEMCGIRVEEIDRASDLTLELHTNLIEIELKDSDGD